MGRGYVKHADLISAKYIREQFIQAGLKPLDTDFFHKFTLDINTIPVAELTIDTLLVPGKDYMVAPYSNGTNIKGRLFYIEPSVLRSSRKMKRIIKKLLKDGLIPVYDDPSKIDMDAMKGVTLLRQSVNTIFILKKSLVWTTSRTQAEFNEIWLLKSKFDPKYSGDVHVKIEAEFIPDYLSQNVVGFVEGTKYPDSFIVMCGHYDHLGMMGEAVFHGANDNASGISILLDLANYFGKNPQNYSIAFIAFGGEEAGLIGSKAFVENPPEAIGLSQIKFVLNMDLMGSGEDGATIVNATLFKKHFDLLVSINESQGYLPQIKPRGKASNSDHHFFTEAGIPSFFIYLMGDYRHYHIPLDNSDELKLSPSYDQAYSLICTFIISLNMLN